MMNRPAAVSVLRRLPLAALAFALLALTGCSLFGHAPAAAGFDRTQTQTHYLSGKGHSDAKPWEFICHGGRNSGVWTTIPVPSQWEQQGFGGYDYGEVRPEFRHREKAQYRLKFQVPAGWRGQRIRLTFEGVMTDATVRVNGKSAGPTHQGGFYRFKYDITNLLDYAGVNLLEVDVAKSSANKSVERGERIADYWIFGGIYRPVYLEASPKSLIDWSAIDARADGSFTLDAHLIGARPGDVLLGRIVTPDGKWISNDFKAVVPADKTDQVRMVTRVANPRTWSAETPFLYRAELILLRGDKPVHQTSSRFGFRTFEIRRGQGLFINGKRVVMKGICRHTFRPETGRTLDVAEDYEDARLIKATNMNAVRMSHYPPDVAFLNACDELGLYVIDELGGWHYRYDTGIGAGLIREFISRDVNHPSILMWDNGNEGGWNVDLDGDFGLWDPQNRRVLHPFAKSFGFDTMHYPYYDEVKTLLNAPDIAMPTEILHGLLDGGMGSGLEDFWGLMKSHPNGGGMFFWDFADAGIARTDQGGALDVFDTYGCDGLFGPHLERDASFYTIREIFSPIQIALKTLPENFNGTLPVANEFVFTPLDRCRFRWAVVRLPDAGTSPTQSTVLSSGELRGPAIAPSASGALKLKLPADWRTGDVLRLAAFDPDGGELWTWSWEIGRLKLPAAVREAQTAAGFVPPVERGNEIVLATSQAGVIARFDKTGSLLGIEKDGRKIDLSGGPRLAYAQPVDEDLPGGRQPQWFRFDSTRASAGEDPANVAKAFDDNLYTTWTASAPGAWIQGEFKEPRLANLVSIYIGRTRGNYWHQCKLQISPDGKTWKTVFDSRRREWKENQYDFPPQRVKAVRMTAIGQSAGAPLNTLDLKLGFEPERFPKMDGARPAALLTADAVVLKNSGGLTEARWSMTPNGVLRLDYRYDLPKGQYEYAGISFDYPEPLVKSKKWLGEGPYPVWKNRLKGTSLGVHQVAYNDNRPEFTWNFPEFKGYFADMRWLRLDTAQGPITFATDTPNLYYRLWSHLPCSPEISPNFPAGDISFLHAIPPMGTKFKKTTGMGPQSAWNKAGGIYEGRLYFEF